MRGQTMVIQRGLTTSQFAGAPDNFFRLHSQSRSQPKKSVHSGNSQTLLDKSHGLPVMATFIGIFSKIFTSAHSLN